ncbi:MAG: winged helix-turn-helix domain-containing protein [Pseudomonadota bacterium]
MQTSSIADVLFTKSQQRVLALLYAHPDESLYGNEIVRRAGMGRGTIRRELQRLSSAGLLLTSREGNQQYFRANPDSPVFNELRGIVTKTLGLTEVLREALLPLGKAITLAFIYGRAADEGDPRAEIDVMVVGEVSLEEVIAALYPCQSVIDRAINPGVLTPEAFLEAMSVEYSSFAEVMGQPIQTILGKADAFKALGLGR